jgi:hypothetical protein
VLGSSTTPHQQGPIQDRAFLTQLVTSPRQDQSAEPTLVGRGHIATLQHHQRKITMPCLVRVGTMGRRSSPPVWWRAPFHMRRADKKNARWRCGVAGKR